MSHTVKAHHVTGTAKGVTAMPFVHVHVTIEELLHWKIYSLKICVAVLTGIA